MLPLYAIAMQRATRDALLQLSGVVALAAIAIGFGIAVRDNPDVAGFIAQFGYPGVFIAAIIAGFNLLVPIPIVTFVPAFLAADMNPVIIVLLITVGTTLSDGAAYVIGNVVRQVALSRRQERVKRILEKLRAKNSYAPMIALYLYASFVPLPNEVAIVPLAVLGHRPGPIMLAVLLGNLTFNTIVTLTVLQIL